MKELVVVGAVSVTTDEGTRSYSESLGFTVASGRIWIMRVPEICVITLNTFTGALRIEPVTDNEFSIAIPVIRKCDYIDYFLDGKIKYCSREETMAYIKSVVRDWPEDFTDNAILTDLFSECFITNRQASATWLFGYNLINWLFGHNPVDDRNMFKIPYNENGKIAWPELFKKLSSYTVIPVRFYKKLMGVETCKDFNSDVPVFNEEDINNLVNAGYERRKVQEFMETNVLHIKEGKTACASFDKFFENLDNKQYDAVLLDKIAPDRFKDAVLAVTEVIPDLDERFQKHANDKDLLDAPAFIRPPEGHGDEAGIIGIDIDRFLGAPEHLRMEHNKAKLQYMAAHAELARQQIIARTDAVEFIKRGGTQSLNTIEAVAYLAKTVCGTDASYSRQDRHNYLYLLLKSVNEYFEESAKDSESESSEWYADRFYGSMFLGIPILDANPNKIYDNIYTVMRDMLYDTFNKDAVSKLENKKRTDFIKYRVCSAKDVWIYPLGWASREYGESKSGWRRTPGKSETRSNFVVYSDKFNDVLSDEKFVDFLLSILRQLYFLRSVSYIKKTIKKPKKQEDLLKVELLSALVLPYAHSLEKLFTNIDTKTMDLKQKQNAIIKIMVTIAANTIFFGGLSRLKKEYVKTAKKEKSRIRFPFGHCVNAMIALFSLINDVDEKELVDDIGTNKANIAAKCREETKTLFGLDGTVFLLGDGIKGPPMTGGSYENDVHTPEYGPAPITDMRDKILTQSEVFSGNVFYLALDVLLVIRRVYDCSMNDEPVPAE
jgi:hypothetical protein